MTVKVTEDIGAPLTAVWEIVGNFGGLARWHPLVKGCELSGAGVGAIRRVLFQDWHAEECLDAFDDDEHQLIYRVTASSKAELIGVCGQNSTACTGEWEHHDRVERLGRSRPAGRSGHGAISGVALSDQNFASS